MPSSSTATAAAARTGLLWALASGGLGALASCFAKLAFSPLDAAASGRDLCAHDDRSVGKPGACMAIINKLAFDTSSSSEQYRTIPASYDTRNADTRNADTRNASPNKSQGTRQAPCCCVDDRGAARIGTRVKDVRRSYSS